MLGVPHTHDADIIQKEPGAADQLQTRYTVQIQPVTHRLSVGYLYNITRIEIKVGKTKPVPQIDLEGTVAVWG